MNGKPFSNTKDTTVTKEKMRAIKAFYLFVYFVPFVVRLFPVKNGKVIILKQIISAFTDHGFLQNRICACWQF